MNCFHLVEPDLLQLAALPPEVKFLTTLTATTALYFSEQHLERFSESTICDPERVCVLFAYAFK